MTLKKYLTQFTQQQLAEQIAELAKTYPEVRLYFQYHQDPENRALHDKMEKKLRDLCYPARGRRPRFKRAAEVVTTYRKLCPPPEDMAAMLYVRLERATQFSKDRYLAKTGTLLKSLQKCHKELKELIEKEGLGRQWAEKAEALEAK